MNYRVIRYPGFLSKAVTLSYDDGVVYDRRLIDIMAKNGIRGTFNINSGFFRTPGTEGIRFTKEEALALYDGVNFEVAVHGLKHLSIADYPGTEGFSDVWEDRKNLEAAFGRIVRGMAYPNGSFDDRVVGWLPTAGIRYSRTTKATHDFRLPQSWLLWHPTCRHLDPELSALTEKFLSLVPEREYDRTPRLFYLWGHSYEFPRDDNWNVIEDFCARVGGRADIWYATNMQIVDYIDAARAVEFSLDNTIAHNPTATDAYFEQDGRHVLVPAGATVSMN